MFKCSPKCLTFLPLFAFSVVLTGCQNSTPYFKTAGEPIKVKGSHSSRMLTANQLINALKLEGPVDGGYLKQTFKADHRPMFYTSNGNSVTQKPNY